MKKTTNLQNPALICNPPGICGSPKEKYPVLNHKTGYLRNKASFIDFSAKFVRNFP